MRTSFDYDIVIIGAGPAGSTFARMVDSHRYRVLLLDGQTQADSKPCGGLLAPDAQKALAQFDLTLPKEILVDPQIFSVKTIDVCSGDIRYYPRSYLNMDRFRFDQWLVSLIPQSVSVWKGISGQAKRLPQGGFSLDIRLTSGEMKTITARYLIGADGAKSMVRRTFFPGREAQHYVAIQQWFPCGEENPFYSCIFDPETSDSCSWSICKDEYLIFGGAFAPKNCRENFEKQKERLAPFGFTFGEPVKTEACLVLRPRSYRSFCTGKDGVFLLGEAAGFISPSSLEGISSAINTGFWLSQAFSGEEEKIEKSYSRRTRTLKVKLLFKCVKRMFMYQPFLRRMVMKSGLQTIKMNSPK